MPHVELVGLEDLAAFHERFRPRSVRLGEAVLKASASYLSGDGRTLLVDCLTAEGSMHQSFFVLVTAHPARPGKPGRIMVRLLPRTSPEKTDAVKRCVVWIALWFRSLAPVARIGTTNLEPHLDVSFPAEAIAP